MGSQTITIPAVESTDVDAWINAIEQVLARLSVMTDFELSKLISHTSQASDQFERNMQLKQSFLNYMSQLLRIEVEFHVATATYPKTYFVIRIGKYEAEVRFQLDIPHNLALYLHIEGALRAHRAPVWAKDLGQSA